MNGGRPGAVPLSVPAVLAGGAATEAMPRPAP